jgi:hypothetical protein
MVFITEKTKDVVVGKGVKTKKHGDGGTEEHGEIPPSRKKQIYGQGVQKP